jgi:hypothetical protein
LALALFGGEVLRGWERSRFARLADADFGGADAHLELAPDFDPVDGNVSRLDAALDHLKGHGKLGGHLVDS